MTSTSLKLPELKTIALWTVLVPFVGLWPFLSAMPIFTLMGGNVTLVTGSLNVMALITGFWSAFPLAIALWFMLSADGKAAFRRKKTSWLTPITLYVLIWTVGYMLLSIMDR